MEDLRGVPEHLAQNPVSDLRTGMRDISNFVLAQSREGAVLGYNYPAQFADHVFEGADGERIAATIASFSASSTLMIGSSWGWITNSGTRAPATWRVPDALRQISSALTP